MKEKKSLSAVESEEQCNKQLSHHHCFVLQVHHTLYCQIQAESK